jgi:hypothetical protein
VQETTSVGASISSSRVAAGGSGQLTGPGGGVCSYAARIVSEGLPLHRPDAPAEIRGHRGRVPAVTVEPGAEGELHRFVELPRVEQGVFLLVEGIQLGRLLVAAERRCEEDERADASGMREREVERHAASEGVADDCGPLQPQMVEERAGVLDVGERAARQRRFPEAAQVRAEDQVPVGERLRLRVPEPPVADACVKQEDGRAVTARVVGDLGAVEPRGAQFSGVRASRKRRASTWRRAQATWGCSSTKGRNSHGVSP